MATCPYARLQVQRLQGLQRGAFPRVCWLPPRSRPGLILQRSGLQGSAPLCARAIKPGYEEIGSFSNQYDTGSVLSKAVTKSLSACQTLEELVTESESDHMDAICIATTWYKLGTLYTESTDGDCKAFGRRLLGRTLAFMHCMELRVLANVLWGIGKIKLELASENIGHYFAEAVEGRALELMGTSQFDDARNLSQLWFGLHSTRYPWTPDFLRALTEITVTKMKGFSSLQAAKICVQFVALLMDTDITVNECQRESLTVTIARLLQPARNSTFYDAVDGLLFAAARLQLRQDPLLLQQVHSCILLMPPITMREKGRTHMAGSLCWLTLLGFQPTQQEAKAWAQLLLEDIGGKWTTDNFSWTVAALSWCRNYQPPAELKERLRTVAAGLTTQKSGPAKRVFEACRAWGVQI